jgi:hypothetical protein
MSFSAQACGLPSAFPSIALVWINWGGGGLEHFGLSITNIIGEFLGWVSFKLAKHWVFSGIYKIFSTKIGSDLGQSGQLIILGIMMGYGRKRASLPPAYLIFMGCFLSWGGVEESKMAQPRDLGIWGGSYLG